MAQFDALILIHELWFILYLKLFTKPTEVRRNIETNFCFLTEHFVIKKIN